MVWSLVGHNTTVVVPTTLSICTEHIGINGMYVIKVLEVNMDSEKGVYLERDRGVTWEQI